MGASAARSEEIATELIVQGILPVTRLSSTGSYQRIDLETLRRMQPLTLKEVARRLPGVQVIDEDALGLKLNISVRGLNPRRSGRTLLLEDGMPIQPAPYADPSAHYYPTLERIRSLEFIKGSGQILYGPQSIGGMINLRTLDVPQSSDLSLSLSGGGHSKGAYLGLARAKAGLGFRFDLTHKEGHGIRDYHATRLDDVSVKGHLPVSDAHRVDVKWVLTEEKTSLTESGLTEARFQANPYANPFRHDRFRLRREALQLVEHWQMAPGWVLATQIYAADTFRASYRQTDTSVDTMTANPATGCVGAAPTDYEGSAELCGNKMRPRRFRFLGVESRAAGRLSIFGFLHRLEVGGRIHIEDTRRQRFNGLTPTAREYDAGTALRDDNRIRTQAYSLFIEDAITGSGLTLSPGVRFESIRTQNIAARANFLTVDNRSISHQTLVLPGVGLNWQQDKLELFAGVHKGFAPPRPDRDLNPNGPASLVKPEKSLESELGLRWRDDEHWQIEATLFEMRLDDLIVEGPLVGGRSGSFVNAGRGLHQGLEWLGRWHSGPVNLTMTHTSLFTAKFLTDVDETSKGVKGNRIPYTPRALSDLALDLALGRDLSLQLGLNHVSEQYANANNSRTTTADGMSGIVPARTLWRGALTYAPEKAVWRAYLSAENLSDEAYISSRVDGLFVGTGRRITAGLSVHLP